MRNALCAVTLAGCAALLGFSTPQAAQSKPPGGVQKSEKPPRLTTAITYADQRLIMFDDANVAVLELTGVDDEHVKYHYSYLRSDSDKLVTGDDEVFVKYTKLDPKSPLVTPDPKNRPNIKVGPFSVEWSLRDKNSGYVYWSPEDLRISVVTRDAVPVDPTRFFH